ncbi:MAG: thiamine-phosphate kinase [Rhodospirillaceae bacterium]|nr:thiamine-phosphate kinase [Rhodospirillaceae bacterium]
MGDKKSLGLGEFDLIAKYFAPLSVGCEGALSLLDDGAVLDIPEDESLVVSTDCMTEGIHFLEGTAGKHVATRVLGANLSDLAAMGATPKWIFLSLQLPKNTNEHREEWLEGFSAALGSGLEKFGVSLAGGDTVATLGPLTVTITALGSIKKGSALKRSGARPGDEIWVSGTLGDAQLGLEILQMGDDAAKDAFSDEDADFLIGRHHLPEPRVELGKLLAQMGSVNACIDISDGLVADMSHICEASNVTAEIQLSNIPLSSAAKVLLDYDPTRVHKAAFGGGDDYELLFCLSPENSEQLNLLKSKTPFCKIGKIGTISEKSQNKGHAVKIVDPKGENVVVESGGWDHLK